MLTRPNKAKITMQELQDLKAQGWVFTPAYLYQITTNRRIVFVTNHPQGENRPFLVIKEGS